MIDRETLTRVTIALAEAEFRDVDLIAAQLRTQIEGLIVTTCDEDDICGIHALAETPGINLYLLSSSGTCLGLTRDPESAIGVVLAQVREDAD